MILACILTNNLSDTAYINIIYLYNIIVLSFSGCVDSCIAGPAKDQQKPCQNRARVRIYIMLLKGKRIYVWHLSAAN